MSTPMNSGALTFRRIVTLDGGIWRGFKCPKDIVFRKHCLVYGPNGSGKTTLSRVFSSIRNKKASEGLPDGMKFKIELSDGSEVTQTLSDVSIDNNLFVYNSDFVQKSIRWNECNADGITYFGEEKVDILLQYEENERNISELSERISVLSKANSDAIKALSDFSSGLAKEIREIPGVDTYTQRYDKKKIESAYHSDTYHDDYLLSETERSHAIKEVTQGKSFEQIDNCMSVPDGIWEWLVLGVNLVTRKFSHTFIKELENHSETFTRLEWLVEYHDSNRLDDCLLCGQPFSEERRGILRELFDDSWRSSLDKYIALGDEGVQYRAELDRVLRSIPQTGVMIEAKREEYDVAKRNYVSVISDITMRVKLIIAHLEAKAENPIKDINIEQDLSETLLQGLQQRYNELREGIVQLVESHNDAVGRRDEVTEAAFNRLEKHKLAEKQEKWNELKSSMESSESEMGALREEMSSLERKKEVLQSNLFDHGKGAELLNKTIRDYLGHDEIYLVAEKGGYKILRTGGETARELSEGEKSAIAICYFLTLLEGDGRKPKDLVVVIDDPVSSLDSVARTQAFSLIIRRTKMCAQTIILTHSIEFMNMIKRQYQPKYKKKCETLTASLLFLNYRYVEDGVTRSVELQWMHSPLLDYESEYHYLFSVVYEAAHSSDNVKLFELPNVTRKLLEMFASVCSPDKVTFAEALMDHYDLVKDDVDIKALERLVQIESHGKMEGLSSFPDLTLDHAKEAAVQALKFMMKVSCDHYKRMENMYKRHKRKEVAVNNNDSTSVES